MSVSNYKFKRLYVFFVFIILTSYNVFGVEHARSVSKRQELGDYQTCAPNFEIHQDKIIRTEESKRMGAKYLNGKDVRSKNECITFCCETDNCNVFVLEEKVFNQQQGTCYLFECGTPENFKCKFTRHHNYSSAVLIINRPQIQVEDEIQYTQHERELTNLRIGENTTKSKTGHHSAKTNFFNEDQNYTKNVPVRETLKATGNGLDLSFKKTGRCSRYQFECRSSGECIAIYNACDGIPQCADHSDEDIELGCPTAAPIVTYKKSEEMHIEKHASTDNAPRNRVLDNALVKPYSEQYNKEKINPGNTHDQMSGQKNLINQQPFNRPYKTNQWQSKMNPQSYNSATRNDLPSMNENYQPNLNPDMKISPQQSQHSNSGLIYGREGELMDNSWPEKTNEVRIFKQNYGPLHNFNHKQNEINIPYNYGDYGNVRMNSPHENYNNGYPGKNYYQPNMNMWHHKTNMPSSYEDEQKYQQTKNNKITPEHYYEEANGPETKIRELPQMETISTEPKITNNASKSTSKSVTIMANVNGTTNVTKSTTQHTKETTLPDITTINEKKDHQTTADIKLEQKQNDALSFHNKLENRLSVEISSVQEQFLDANVMDGYTEQPSGAFISLTLGVCVTMIMVFVVGCRLKVVRKRIRRGKLPYSHDADFLVNGMYL